ncbi:MULTISPECIES: hypothetical protein [unclassified Microbacterium]|uniref:hypothetical protein n=1 Tax=unclassified Microbacterium TaxID=2609290 RepID=UPI001783B138|nr:MULTISPECIES: hypothetical protein [unclassified Microbacterium]MBD8205782.1 hypothetical protein [Microbacterium sp. CFBP 8801]MBD8476782.1 hypothetical protein [Microbacterium sp. CFBP 8794]MBD8509356.1 hypothetical protein [Microbacterium sp. CFBP 8790]
MLVLTAVTTSASIDPTVWLRVIAEWGASSSGHVPWSASLLVTTVGALAALSNSPLAKDEILGLALTLCAQAIAVGTALWMVTALVGATVPDIVSEPIERSQLWGVVFVAGPVIIGAAVFAGRFTRVGPDVRIAVAERAIPVLDRELGETRWRVHELWSLTRARCHAWMPPVAAWVAATSVLLAILSAEGTTAPGSTAFAVIVFSMVWGSCALALGLLRITFNQPTGRIWQRRERSGRRLTPLGRWLIGATAALGGLSICSSVALTAVLFIDSDPATAEARLRLAAVLLGGTVAVSIAVLKSRRGKNSWATIGYRLRARRRESFVTQLREAQAERDSRRAERSAFRRLRALLRGR